MVEWLHSNLRNAQDKLTTRINKQSLQIPDCQSVEQVSGLLNYRKTPPEMRRRRDSELHVAQTQTQTQGRRKLSLKTYQILSQLFAGSTL